MSSSDWSPATSGSPQFSYLMSGNSVTWSSTAWFSDANTTADSSVNLNHLELNVYIQDDFGFRERAGEEQEEREQAEKVAEELLSLHIGEEQFKRYKESGVVKISSVSRPQRTYRVNSLNRIEVYEDGKLIDRLCVHLVNEANHKDSYWLPEADVVLGKIFLLENDEERLLRVANHEQVS